VFDDGSGKGGIDPLKVVVPAVILGGLYLWYRKRNPKPDKYDDKYVALPGVEESVRTKFFRYRDDDYIDPNAQSKYVGAVSDVSNLPASSHVKGH
jgi:hypothetical protein